jgi:hypothetical protein
MSQTRIISDTSQGRRKLGGVHYGPDPLTSREIDRAHNTVHDGLLKPCGIEPLVDLLCQRGLAAHGLLGCVQVPVGDPVFSFAGTAMKYRKTVPVWVLETGTEMVRRGHTHRGVTYMNTNQFVSWISKQLDSPMGGPSFGGQQSQPLGPILEEQVSAPQRQVVPLPSVRITPPSVIRVPLPSTVPAFAAGGLVSPPSYVSQLGDINTDNRDSLAQAESEFRSVPRLDGGARYDPDEYVQRITSLNMARAGANLLPVQGITPSTYTR